MPYMCKQQRYDLQQILDAADAMGEAATAMMTHGGLSYISLFEARKNFHNIVMESATNYRRVVEVEEDPEEV